MAVPTYYEKSEMTAIPMLVGVWRHSPLMCKPGFYRVVMRWLMTSATL
jgi:hypothetical protein